MIPAFSFATAQRIDFGCGCAESLGPIAAELHGQRALLVCGRSLSRIAWAVSALEAQGINVTTFSVPDEPDIETVSAGTDLGRSIDADLVVAVGGGSAIDAGKIIAAMLANPGQVLDYLEVVGLGKPLALAPVPLIAVPTTAGTGAEVTRNGVVRVPEHAVKVSMRHPLMLPNVALVDPQLTVSLPPAPTACTGMDATVQVLEAFTSSKANLLTDAICREALPKTRLLARACDHGDDLEARTAMAFVSLAGGLALANAGLGAVHGIAGPAGGRFDAPHGALCAALLPPILETNVRALKARSPTSAALARYAEAAKLMLSPQSDIHDLIAAMREQAHHLSIPRLSAFGLTPQAIPDLVASSQRASSMRGNPIPLTDDELTAAIHSAL